MHELPTAIFPSFVLLYYFAVKFDSGRIYFITLLYPQVSTPADQKTPETDTVKPQRRSSSRKVRFTSEPDSITKSSHKEEFETKMKELKSTLQSSQDIDELTKTVTKDMNKTDKCDDSEDLAQPIEAMDTDSGGEVIVEDSVLMSEEIPLASDTVKPKLSVKRVTRRKSSDQSTGSSQLSECSMEVAAFCSRLSKPKAVDSPSKPGAVGSQRTRTIRGRAKLPENMSPIRETSDKKSCVDEKNAIDKFLTRSVEKLKSVRVSSKAADTQTEEKKPKVSTADSVVLVEDTEQFSPKRRSPRKQTKVAIVNNTPAKEDGVVEADYANQASKQLFSSDFSPNEIPDSQDCLESSQSFTVKCEEKMSPHNHGSLDQGVLESFGLTTPTKSHMSPKDMADASRSPVVHLVRLSQEEISHYSPKRNKFVVSLSGSFSSESVESTSERNARRTRVRRKGSLIGMGEPPQDEGLKEEPKDLITLVDQETPKYPEVQMQASVVNAVADDSIEVDIDAQPENVSDKDPELNSVSQIPVGTLVEADTIDSLPDSQATIVPKQKRKRSIPSWLKGMHTPDQDKKSNIHTQESDSSQSQEPHSKSKGRRGRKKKLNIDDSEQWSQQQNTDQSQEIQPESMEPLFVPEVAPTFAEDLSECQSQSLVSGASHDKEETSVEIAPVQEQEASQKSKKRGRRKKLKPSSDKGVAVDTSTQNEISVTVKDTASLEIKPDPKSRLSRKDKKVKDSSEQIVEIEPVVSGNIHDQSIEVGDEPPVEQNQDLADDAPLSQSSTTEEVPVADNKTNKDGDNDSSSETSCQDIFGIASTDASTHITQSESILVDSEREDSKKKRRPGKRQTDLKTQLDINMKSPLIKRLRSQKPHLRTRALNRSLDSLQPKKKRGQRRSPSQKAKDDLAIDEAKVELKELATEEQNTVDDSNIVKSLEAEECPQPDAQSEEGVNSSRSESPEARVSRVMDTLNAGKEPSPVKQSPPKKGKPFDIPDTPTSASRSSMSRASMILQRARMMFVKPSKSPPSLRARALARGNASDSKLMPRRSGILKSPNSTSSPSGKGSIHSSGSPTSSFRPIQMPRIYSPSASPSAGILRKRRLSGDECTDSPSPPMKVRNFLSMSRTKFSF